MRIDPQAQLLSTMLNAAVPKRPEPPRFSGGASPPAPAAPPTVSSPVQSVQMLVALAAASGDPDRRMKMAREAEAGLDGLEKLHKALAAGVVAPERLRALRAWTQKRGRPDEVELAELMDAIELRILVELAKRERG